MKSTLHAAIIGGGAAGYFAALQAGQSRPGTDIAIFEAGRKPLEKVRISGGGRCNVTHHCYPPPEFALNYPRGSKELRAAFHRFQASDTVAWFTERGVPLKEEADGRMFPVSDSSLSVIECLEKNRSLLNIDLYTGVRVNSLTPCTEGGFLLECSDDAKIHTKRVLIATGSNRSGHEFARALGHTITPLAPSLFTFTIPDPELHTLAGVSMEKTSLTLCIEKSEIARHEGPLLVTHWGLSGPAVLKLSAWAARELQEAAYKATLRINWIPTHNEEEIFEKLSSLKQSEKRTVRRSPQFGIPQRLWEYLTKKILPESCEQTWTHIDRKSLRSFARTFSAFELPIRGKGQFKEEFVTCGGVTLAEIDFRTMESKHTPGLYFAGEVLDIDGITGGFNFQAAWTTGWIAGSAIGMATS